jgi:hypothetical protein
MPLVKYRQYVNNPTISAGSPIVKIITRSSSMLEIRIRASSGEYSVYLSSKVTSGVNNSGLSTVFIGSST